MMSMVEGTQKSKADEAELPLYWGWFVKPEYSSSFLSRSRKLLADTLQDIPDFLKDVQNFTQKVYISDILLHYTREKPEEVLHCTAMFNGVYPNYSPGAEEYSEKQQVKDSVNQVSTLHSIGWILTPRTFGARIKLTNDQLLLWNQNDTEGNPPQSAVNAKKPTSPVTHYQSQTVFKENTTNQDPDVMGNFQPTSGFGSKAHLTLGCSPGVGAVTTGYDLVDLIRLEGINSSEVKTYDLSNGGWLRNYGEGQWVFYPTKQFLLESTFLGYDSGTRGLEASLALLCLLCSSVIISMFKELS
ncbi:2',3'-cyclic-nucleotide 3'-phosphodiesterase-like isoform X2 [Daphnia carinata]|nr:2',3'-cyclic-nucleotide 3'-phosphodiesterase-like isoform X2 [Daphnia carinata]